MKDNNNQDCAKCSRTHNYADSIFAQLKTYFEASVINVSSSRTGKINELHTTEQPLSLSDLREFFWGGVKFSFYMEMIKYYL